ncbi:MAG TPA: HK97 gp10 family phage protein [Pseudolabrys sp.]|nr:HK97 gp10 family phage protein [Pseudolabrys sp.]
MTRVFRQSAQEVVSAAANRVPIDTGFARASVLASTSAMPSIDPNKKGAGTPANFAAAEAEVSLVIAGAKIGQTIFVGWTAAYVGALEYGHSKQAPEGFVRLAAQRWPAIVAEVSARAEMRAGE